MEDYGYSKKKNEILDLYYSGDSVSKISKKLKLKSSTVKEIIKEEKSIYGR